MGSPILAWQSVTTETNQITQDLMSKPQLRRFVELRLSSAFRLAMLGLAISCGNGTVELFAPAAVNGGSGGQASQAGLAGAKGGSAGSRGNSGGAAQSTGGSDDLPSSGGLPESPSTPNCRSRADCPPGQVCPAGACSACFLDEQCESWEVCRFGKCTRSCDKDAVCGADQRCDPGVSICVDCLEPSDCRAPRNICSEAHICVECTGSDQCDSELKPQCGGQGECVCLGSMDCPPHAPICDPQWRRCVQCNDVLPCMMPERPYCISDFCVACRVDAECERAEFPVCSDGLCVECDSDHQCANGDCDLSTNRCVG